MYCTCCVSVPSPEESQPKKQSIASRLSEKFQASLNSDCKKDDDFQSDRKRIRTAEHKVVVSTLYTLLYISIEFTVYFIQMVTVYIFWPHDIKERNTNICSVLMR